MEDQIQQIQTEYLDKIAKASTLEALDELYLLLFGKSGLITLLPKEFPNLDKDRLRIIAPLFNQTKNQLEQEIGDRRNEIREEGYKKLETETFDEDEEVEIKDRKGYLHPLTLFEREITELFSKIGFQVYDKAPHIDTDDYNFSLLNIPENHPARDLQDTLYLEDGRLLRTHTSNSQIRIMKEIKTPIRMIIIDRCFRYENLDARHEHTFVQFELVYVDKKVNMGNLQYLSEYFLKAVLNKDIEARLKPKYYPFVEPGAGVEGMCLFCQGKGCQICGKAGWLELGGAGMIHPTVLKNGGINPDEYSGIAWGTGLGRILMLKYGIEDVRTFNNGDLKFIQGFKL